MNDNTDLNEMLQLYNTVGRQLFYTGAHIDNIYLVSCAVCGRFPGVQMYYIFHSLTIRSVGGRLLEVI